MKTLLIRAVIVLVLVNAVTGIAVLLAGDFGDFEGRVLLTTLSVTAGSVLLLACIAAAETRVVDPLGYVGAAFVLVAFGLLVAGIWTEFDFEGAGNQSETFWRSTATAVTISVCLSYVCLISLRRLSRRFTYVRMAAYFFAAGVALEILLAIWSEELGLSNENLEEAFWRLLGVSTILLAAATIIVPLLPRTPARAAPFPAVHPIAFCPSCAATISAENEEVRCPNCGGRFRVTELAVT
jgi:hypothetical protein